MLRVFINIQPKIKSKNIFEKILKIGHGFEHLKVQ